MKIKAIRDLCQLSDAELFRELAEGLRLILENANRIEDDARLLRDQQQRRGWRVLRTVAEEEAAKFLILMDGVRCPRQPGENFAKTLSYFHNHLAKGIYAEYCAMTPATFGEIRNWIETERRDFYLDGPTGVDWIFYNDILQKREDALYVDYIENDQEHIWSSPLRLDDLAELDTLVPPALKLAQALYEGGCTEVDALACIAEIWRPVVMTDEFTWAELEGRNEQTLQELQDRGLLNEHRDEACELIRHQWLYPLHSLDLHEKKVDVSELRAIQDNWYPEM